MDDNKINDDKTTARIFRELFGDPGCDPGLDLGARDKDAEAPVRQLSDLEDGGKIFPLPAQAPAPTRDLWTPEFVTAIQTMSAPAIFAHLVFNQNPNYFLPLDHSLTCDWTSKPPDIVHWETKLIEIEPQTGRRRQARVFVGFADCPDAAKPAILNFLAWRRAGLLNKAFCPCILHGHHN